MATDERYNDGICSGHMWYDKRTKQKHKNMEEVAEAVREKKIKRVISSSKEKKQKEYANELNDSECQNEIF